MSLFLFVLGCCYYSERALEEDIIVFLRVMLLTGLGRSTIYKFMADETDFPKSVPLGGRAVAWIESEIEEWMESRLSMRDNQESF